MQKFHDFLRRKFGGMELSGDTLLGLGASLVTAALGYVYGLGKQQQLIAENRREIAEMGRRLATIEALLFQRALTGLPAK